MARGFDCGLAVSDLEVSLFFNELTFMQKTAFHNSNIRYIWKKYVLQLT